MCGDAVLMLVMTVPRSFPHGFCGNIVCGEDGLFVFLYIKSCVHMCVGRRRI